MIVISINTEQKYYDELKYTFDTVFHFLLGLDFLINETPNIDCTQISSEDGRKIKIEDHFFSRIDDGNDFLSDEYIPKTVKWIKNNQSSFLPEDELPIIYGRDEVITQEDGSILCGIDIFSSIFFMLTRWEEYVVNERDEHGRFPATASLAYKCGFLDRPVVNEYIEFLWNMMIHLDPGLERRETVFETIPTHDIDLINKPSVLRNLAGDILKRKNFQLALERLKKITVNEYDTYSWLMDESEKNNLQSRFYFMAGGNSGFDNNFIIEKQRGLLKNIIDRDHVIGFHPSYNAYNDFNLFTQEKKRLENVLGHKVTEGRQHYLRFETPVTWYIWHKADMRIDSTMSYADHEGFRCGTSMEFPVFDIMQRKTLDLIERPLVIMDGTLWIYRKLKIEKCYSIIMKYKEICKKYKMPFTILFHNSSFSETEWSGWKKLYTDILSK